MNNILLSLSLGLNLIFCTLLVNLSYNTIFNLDEVRNTYLRDLRFFTHRGCMEGTQYKPSTTDSYNPDSPMVYCGTLTESYEENFRDSMFNLGRKGK